MCSSQSSQAYYDLIGVPSDPIMSKVILSDVTDVVMPRNSASTTLPLTNQADLTGQPYDSMDVSEVVRGITTIDELQALPAIWIGVKTKSSGAVGISIRSSIRGRSLWNGIA